MEMCGWTDRVGGEGMKKGKDCHPNWDKRRDGGYKYSQG